MSDAAVSGKRVLVTGAARGIGAATARELARRGARLSLVGLEPDLLAGVAADLGAGHLWFEADVTDQASLEAAVDGTVAQFGGLDAAIANAGVGNAGTVRTADPEAFARTIDINLTGVYRTAYAVTPHLVASRGYLLAIASVASFVPLPGSASYGASKAGVESMMGALRAELAGYGVAVGTAHPSWVDTDLVRGSERDIPTFAAMRARLPWPANATMSVESCATALADGVGSRKQRIYIPRTMALVSWMRPILLSSRLAGAGGRRMGKDLAQVDVENQALGATWH